MRHALAGVWRWPRRCCSPDPGRQPHGRRARRRRTLRHRPRRPPSTVHSPEFWRMLMRGSRGLAESYAHGLWDSPDLVALIRLAARNAVADRPRARAHRSALGAAPARARGAAAAAPASAAGATSPPTTTSATSCSTRMLDPTMMYSCALFDEPACPSRRPRWPSSSGSARSSSSGRMTTCSRSGPAGAASPFTPPPPAAARSPPPRSPASSTTTRWSASAAPASSDQITVLMRDYRDLPGSYDKLVSIEMIEAVGWQHIGTFFAAARSF